jgi:hypothetical protein
MKERFAAAPDPIAPTHPARQGLPDQACSAVQEPEPSAAALQGPRERSEQRDPREYAAWQGQPEQARSAVREPEPSAAALQGPREHAVLQGLRERTARQGPPERTVLQGPRERTAVQAAGAPQAGETLPGEEAADGT